MKTELTTKNFKSKLAGLIKSAKSQRDNINAFILFGLKHYEEHGDSTYLTQVLNACVNVKSLPTITIKDFIKEHANLLWTKNKAGAFCFKKQGTEVKVTMPTVTWYNWKGGKHNATTPDMDVIGQAKSLLARIKKAGTHVKDVESAKKVEEALRSIVVA